MAKPIPANPAGLQRRHNYYVAAHPFVPARAVRRPAVRPAPRAHPAVPAEGQALRWGRLLLLVSTLSGGLAVASALELWPPLAASALGLDERGAFYLLMGGVYILATAGYAAWQTRLLHSLDRAAWDARTMAYANLALGAAVGLTLGVMALAAAAIVALLVGLIALLLSVAGDR